MLTFIFIIFIIYLFSQNSTSSSGSSYNSSQNSSSPSVDKGNDAHYDSTDSQDKIETINNNNNNNKIPMNASQENNTQEGFNFFTKVVGVTYENRQQYVKQCYKGQELDLIRDKFNPYDKNAIAVYAGNNQVGFLSKDLAQKLAYKMDTGLKYECFVENITGGDNLYGLNIKINKSDLDQNTMTTMYCSENNNQDSYRNNEAYDRRNYDDYGDDFDSHMDYYRSHEDHDDSVWTYSDLCEYYGCEEDDWPE